APSLGSPAALAEGTPAGYHEGVWKSPVWRLRMIGMAEGASYIVLLAVAMPLKYLAGMPLAVRIAGSVHGALFVVFLVALIQAWADRSWKLSLAAKVFLASLLPFGPFFLDARLRAEQEPSPA